ncbi:MAG: single-stranded-DNA-specific exonuclease RecJ [Vampirovibrionales bacterium]|nr:single-stranded-DNA-specific exonuclease RecJ [Vampirovibrionales bacterium]
MMTSLTRWKLRGQAGEPSAQILAACNGSPIIAKLLLQRGLKTPEAIERFLNLEAYTPTSGLELPDAEQALARMARAIDLKEPILVYGDFDVDGLTGASILVEGLTTLGAKVSHYIPDRVKEGHGLNAAALCRLVSTRQLKLVITTDTGITNFNEISLLKGLGVDTIVTDHHYLPENLPPAIANVNPQRLPSDHPLYYCCGAGTAFKLMEVLLCQRLPKTEAEPAVRRLLDLAATGTVADIVPLVDDNRWIVWAGIQQLSTRERTGFAAILAQATVSEEAPLNTETIGFTIGPRLNALGRLSNATEGVTLLTTRNKSEAEALAMRFEALNRRRQQLCEETFLEAQQILNQQGGLGQQRAVIIGTGHWEPGIIGIVCSRLVEKYHVPAFLYVVNETTGDVRGSARGLDGFSVVQALEAAQEALTQFGGHAGAGGFYLKLSNLSAFKATLHAHCQQVISDAMMRPLIQLDVAVRPEQVSLHLLDLIDRLAPFGPKNPPVLLGLEGVKVAQQRTLGAEGKHRKLLLSPLKGSGQTPPLEALEWGAGQAAAYTPNQPYCFVVSLDRNTFNGQTRLQAIVKGAKATSRLEACLGDDARLDGEGDAAPNDTKAPSAIAMQKPETLPTASGVIWVDHRGRDRVSEFVRDMILPGLTDADCAVYHEGRLPTIPVWHEAMLMSRDNLRAVSTLIMWDLPPDESALAFILSATQPQTVHWVGGKYQVEASSSSSSAGSTMAMPLCPSPEDMLRLIARVVQTQLKGLSGAMALATMASQLATSPAVVTSGLALLQQTGWLSIEVNAAASDEKARAFVGEPNDNMMIRVTAGVHDKPQGTPAEWLGSLAGLQYQQALKQVGVFRQGLLSWPLTRLQALASGQTMPVPVMASV